MNAAPRRRALGLSLLAIAAASAAAILTPAASVQALESTPAAAQRGAGSPPPPPPPVSVPINPQGRGAAPATSSSQPATPLSYTGVVMGRVIDPGSGPVAGATVSLQGGPNRASPPPGTRQAGPPPLSMPPPRVLTDAQGRFAFRQVPRGNYSLMATKPGYSSGEFGRLRPGGPSRPLQIDDGEKLTDIALYVFKFGSIAGRVVDEFGEPVVGASVRVYQRRLVSGRRVFTLGNQVSTDDRGDYRFGNLSPGDYVVAVPIVATTSTAAPATPQARQNLSGTSQGGGGFVPTAGSGGLQLSQDSQVFWQSNTAALAPLVQDGSGRWRAYATQYYPSARLVTQAEPIAIASGAERTGIDFSMRFLPTSRISGRIVGFAEAAASFVLRLIPTDTGEFSSEMEIATTIADGSGAFTFLGVPSGSYVVQTIRVQQAGAGNFVVTPPVLPVPAAGAQRGVPTPAPPPPPPPPPPPTPPAIHWGRTPVTVGDGDIDGLAVQIHEGLTVSGRLEFSGSRPKPDPQRMPQIPVMLESATAQQLPMSGSSNTSRDGRFTTLPAIPGKYFLRIGGSPPGFTLQSITVNGTDAIDRPVELTTESISGVVVTFTDLVTQISGTVRGQSEIEGAMVVIFPADSQGWKEFGVNPTRFRALRSNPKGEFSTSGIIAGSYLIAAIKQDYASEWQDPAYLDLLARTAQRVTIATGERRTVELTLVETSPPAIRRDPAALQSHAQPPSSLRTLPSPHAPASPGQLSSPHPQPPSRSHVSLRERSAARHQTAEAPGDDLPALAQETRGPGAAWSDSAAVVPAPRQAPPRDARPAPPAGPGSISGRVMIDDGQGPRPARLARVIARGGRLQGERFVLTDDEGRFTVPWLPEDDYTVLAQKPAYLPLAYGARQAAPMQGTRIRTHADRPTTGIDITLVRGGVIAGMVTDSLGQPASNVRVTPMTSGVRDGERTFSTAPVGISTTDDRGAFRIYGLRPNRYILQITPPSAAGFDLRLIGDEDIRVAEADASRAKAAMQSAGALRTLAPAPYDTPPTVSPTIGGRSVAPAPMYYPGVLRPGEATEIVVAAAQEIVGLHAQVQYVPAARVSGVVLGPDGQPAQNPRLTLTAVTPGVQNQVSVRVSNGQFVALGVPSGVYRVMASVSGPPGQPSEPGRPPLPPQQYWAMREISVFGDDIDQLTLQVAPPMTISGRVIVDDGPPPDPARVTIRLETAGVPAGGGLYPLRSVQPTADGLFTLTDVYPGRYRLIATISGTAMPAGFAPAPGPPASGSASWSLLASSIDGRDTLIRPFEVTDRSLDSALIVMTSKPAELTGTLLDAGDRPVEGLFVALFSADPSVWSLTSSRVIRAAQRTGPAGTFTFGTVIPGDYFLAVATEIEASEWGVPAFMESLAAAAVKVTIGRGEKKVQNIRLAGREATVSSVPSARPSR